MRKPLIKKCAQCRWRKKIRALSHYGLVLFGRSHWKFTQHCYTRQQVVNIVEGGLFWKPVPPRTFIPFQEKWVPGLKTAKHSPAYVLWGNATGTHPQNWRVLKAYVTYVGLMFTSFQMKRHGWFPVFSVLQALVILSNRLIHLSHLSDLYPNTQVAFLPPPQ